MSAPKNKRGVGPKHIPANEQRDPYSSKPGGSKRPTPAQLRGGAKNPFPKPPLRPLTTTLWEYPSQHYGEGIQGTRGYEGATPSWVIWQLLTRYTRPGNVVLDPMCGGGTTIDVCHDLGRTPIAFDLRPVRDDITACDARELPLDDQSVDFAFIDPPYSTHIAYSGKPECIGELDAAGPDQGAGYYGAMRRVIAELARVLKPNRHMALYVSDSWRKDAGFLPIGFELFTILRAHFEPTDIVAVVRHNAKLRKGNWHKTAQQDNFYLRGFNYLFIMRTSR